MWAFFDTSAVVPLLLVEPHSGRAKRCWDQSTQHYGWQWLRVEAEAALVRRKATPEIWASWRAMEAAFHWVEPPPGWMKSLKEFNRGIGLRAADAGHLYVMEQCQVTIPQLQLVTFDQEMRRAAVHRGLACLSAVDA